MELSDVVPHKEPSTEVLAEGSELDPQVETEEKLSVSLFKILRHSASDWWLLLLGLLGALVLGSVYPFFSIVFGEVISVFSLPADQILEETHPWGATFLALGIAAALGILVKVHVHTCIHIQVFVYIML